MANIETFLPAQQAAAAASEIAINSGMQLKEVAKVLVPNSAVFGVVTFSNVEMALKVTLLVLSVIYTVLHITLLWRKLQSKKITSDPDI